MSGQRNELRTTASAQGWVLAYSCRTLDQFTFTPADGGKVQREIAVYFGAADALLDGYETYWDADGRFLGRPVAAVDVVGVMLGVPACVARNDHLGDTA